MPEGNMAGDGSNNPFGNGAGGVGGASTGGGNNFTTNPEGNGGGGTGTPESYLKSRPQEMGVDPDINPADAAPGGPHLGPDMDKRDDPGNPVGTTAEGNRKPYKGLHNPSASEY